MSRQVFKDGSVLLTGEDMIAALFCRRGAYEIHCSFCEHEGDDEYCEGCTIPDTDHSCSCHICPPCSKCIGSKFEPSGYLINYEQHENKKKKWQCIKASEEVFEKLKKIEESGFHLSAEILSTGEAAIYIEDGEMDYEIEICVRQQFKKVMCEMVLKFDINTPRFYAEVKP